MAQKRLRVALFGNFGTGNLGNDGSLKAMLNMLQRVRPDATLTCICPGYEVIERDYEIGALPVDGTRSTTEEFGTERGTISKAAAKLVDLVRAFLHAREFDVMIVPGTGLFDGVGEKTFGWPYAIFRWFVGARLAGAKILIVSTGVGPNPTRLSRWLLNSAARIAHYRSYRDTVSKEFMKAYGLDVRRDTVFPDIAFGLPTPAAARERTRGPISVGVGVMSYECCRVGQEASAGVYQAYILKLSRFVRWLLDRGYHIRLLVGETTDGRAIHDLLSSLGVQTQHLPHERITVDPAGSLDELMQQMNGVDIVVATRFHNIVCALKMGKPTISIGYAPQHDALLAAMGLGNFCQHIERLDVDQLMVQFDQLVADRERYGMEIAKTCRALEVRLSHQEELFAHVLLSHDCNL